MGDQVIRRSACLLSLPTLPVIVGVIKLCLSWLQGFSYNLLASFNRIVKDNLKK